MRKGALLLALACLLALAAAYATVSDAPVALRTALGLPLVTLLPGYTLSTALVGSRLRPEERLLLSIALTLSLEVTGGVLLSFSRWGISATSWAVLLAGLTVIGALATCAGRSYRSTFRWRPTRIVVPSIVALLCAGAIAVTVAIDRRPSPPPSWAKGYTLFWVVPRGPRSLTIGIESGEFSGMRYRIVVRAGGRILHEWHTGVIEPSGGWARTFRTPPAARIDGYLYTSTQPLTPYRHVYIREGSKP